MQLYCDQVWDEALNRSALYVIPIYVTVKESKDVLPMLTTDLW